MTGDMTDNWRVLNLKSQPRLTVSGLHQLGVAVLWRLPLSGVAGSRRSLHLDPVSGGRVGGVVGVAGDIWRGRVVLWGDKQEKEGLVSPPNPHISCC